MTSYKTTQANAQDAVLKNTGEEKWTFHDVADAAGLTDDDAHIYVHLMRTRFNADKEGKAFHLPYAAEWAARIKHNVAYAYADKKTTAVLEEAEYEEEGR